LGDCDGNAGSHQLTAHAKKLLRAFGEKVFDVIEAEPGRLQEVDGIGPVRAGRITWAERAEGGPRGTCCAARIAQLTSDNIQLSEPTRRA
jgi:hypothetical protein